ncbi:MAG: hypothetical protein MJE77_21275 [Proteobacteria bacterium]|nr:hypothetical protein [Pseudomonadota bacterium]
MTIKEQVDARKHKLGPAQALELARESGQLWVARGKKVLFFDMKNDPPADEELAAVLVGRSGNLRAPTIVAGKVMIVGYNPATLDRALRGGRPRASTHVC